MSHIFSVPTNKLHNRYCVLCANEQESTPSLPKLQGSKGRNARPKVESGNGVLWQRTPSPLSRVSGKASSSSGRSPDRRQTHLGAFGAQKIRQEAEDIVRPGGMPSSEPVWAQFGRKLRPLSAPVLSLRRNKIHVSYFDRAKSTAPADVRSVLRCMASRTLVVISV